ncbi:MAG: hypothetical protein HC877_11780 [Thioploca sp.]|nr:hypothetical protein [Thioploca sp.]
MLSLLTREKTFGSMMQVKNRIDNEWAYIDSLLEQASSKKLEFSSLPDFAKKLEDTLGLTASDFPDGSIESLYDRIQQMQSYFYLSAYDLYTIMNTLNHDEASANDWNRVYQLLALAHQKKVFDQRKQEIRKSLTSDLKLVLPLVLGNDDAESIEELKIFLLEQDFQDLEIALKDNNQDKVCEILLVAWRNREGSDPIAEKEEWKGMYAAEDVTSILNISSMAADTTAQRWKTFGQDNLHQLAEFGLAISSPILLLIQGKRVITLTFEFLENLNLSTPENIFRVLLSTNKGWIEVSSEVDVEATKGTTKELEIIERAEKLQFKITLSPKKAPITAPLSDTVPESVWPILKILYRGTDETSNYYNALTSTFLTQINIDISVTGMSDFDIWNDLQKLDSSKPFDPFGPRPVVGSRFYISHPDIHEKYLSAITFFIKWANELSDSYYNGYSTTINKTSFNILTGKGDDSSTRKECKLFPVENKISMSSITRPKTIYWELLAPDFQHSIYPGLAVKKATELAIALAQKSQNFDEIKKIAEEIKDTSNNDKLNKLTDTVLKIQSSKAEDYFINPPYLPVISKLTIGYSSTSKLSEENNEIKLFHIQPFGYTEIQPVEKPSKENQNVILKIYPFLPRFDNAGELYIGLEKLNPPQQLNILFQMAEGSANADLPADIVHWDYLSGNQWCSLEHGNILSDGTRGLINSGIIKFALPTSQPSTLLSPYLYWLRASISKYPNSVCDTVAIHTQAVLATRVDDDTIYGSLNQSLAAGTIQKLLNPLPAIKTIRQPYSSFGGKGAESDTWFYTRVSERLRHKQRALTPWDYEHLVLERFPQIHKVKCIPASLLSEDSPPGSVEVIVIPDIRNRLPADPFAPKAPTNLLSDIQTYLQAIAPDSAKIKVKNAQYISFTIRMGIRFQAGYDEGYHQKLLNEALNRFLAPWAYAEGADIIIGGKIYANNIINFVERLPYIDYIAHLTFIVPVGYKETVALDGVNNSIAVNSHNSVLVPVPEHIFDPIPESGYEAESFIGINYMRIEVDFEVAPNDMPSH